MALSINLCCITNHLQTNGLKPIAAYHCPQVHGPPRGSPWSGVGLARSGLGSCKHLPSVGRTSGAGLSKRTQMSDGCLTGWQGGPAHVPHPSGRWPRPAELWAEIGLGSELHGTPFHCIRLVTANHQAAFKGGERDSDLWMGGGAERHCEGELGTGWCGESQLLLQSTAMAMGSKVTSGKLLACSTFQLWIHLRSNSYHLLHACCVQGTLCSPSLLPSVINPVVGTATLTLQMRKP